MAKFIHVVLKMPGSFAKLLLFAKAVLLAITGNAAFSSPTPSIATLGQLIEKLESVLLKGTGLQRKAAAEALREALKHLADYVQTVTEEQPSTVDILALQALIESAGMHNRKVGGPPKARFAAKYGAVSGDVDLTAPASPRDTHEWGVSTDQHNWQALPSTRRARTQVTGLPVGVPHYFRHRVLTKTGYTEWSDPLVTIVVK